MADSVSRAIIWCFSYAPSEISRTKRFPPKITSVSKSLCSSIDFLSSNIYYNGGLATLSAIFGHTLVRDELYIRTGVRAKSIMIGPKMRASPHTQSRFWLVRARSYDEGAHWETCVMLRDIRDYTDQESKVVNYPVLAADHYLRLTMIAENAALSAREFKLYASQDGTELPKLEALPQKEVQAEQ